MDVQRYDVFLTGKLADGLTHDVAAQRLAALFKSTPADMTAMLTGKPHLLKRNIDKATALKYREVLQKAGLEVAFKALSPTPPLASESAAAAPPATTKGASSEWQVAAAGTDLLRADERRTDQVQPVDTSHLSVAALGPLPPQQNAVIAQIPDIGHLSLAAAGVDLLNNDERARPLTTINTPDLSLAPAGATIETLATAVQSVQPEISHLSLAPAGTELLTDEQKHRPRIAAPDTTYIQLADR